MTHLTSGKKTLALAANVQKSKSVVRCIFWCKYSLITIQNNVIEEVWEKTSAPYPPEEWCHFRLHISVMSNLSYLWNLWNQVYIYIRLSFPFVTKQLSFCLAKKQGKTHRELPESCYTYREHSDMLCLDLQNITWLDHIAQRWNLEYKPTTSHSASLRNQQVCFSCNNFATFSH